MKDGTRTQRSTKTTDRKKAQKIADKFEQAARNKMTARQVQRVISELYRDITGDALHFPTVREHFQSWLKRKKPEIAPTSYASYSRKAQDFLGWLGEHADRQITFITRDDIVAFRDAELVRISPQTVNDGIKWLRMVFKTARDDGKLQDNPVDGVRPARANAPGMRRAFTLPELRRIIEHADDEWRSLIYFGLYTGQRLGDLARLTWQNVDLERDEIRFITRKTRRQMIIPIAAPLRANIERLPAGEDPRQPLHPRAFASVESPARYQRCRANFTSFSLMLGLLRRRFIASRTARQGVPAAADFLRFSFHALRHTATSLMKNAGISATTVQDIIGHESAAISCALHSR